MAIFQLKPSICDSPSNVFVFADDSLSVEVSDRFSMVIDMRGRSNFRKDFGNNTLMPNNRMVGNIRNNTPVNSFESK